MPAVRLRNVNWKAACEAAGTLSRSKRGLSAQVLSLAALYSGDFDTATAHLRQASRLEPLSPQHELRKALLFARYGDYKRASPILEKLKASLPDAPLVDYLRALLALRAGRPEQARAITGALETSHPQFVPSKFLRAEAQLIMAARPSAIERYLVALPSGVQWDSLWADLLIKLIFLHPQDGPAQARKYLEKKVSPNSSEHALVLKALSWVGATVDDLSQHLSAEGAGSPGEALLLECLVERLNRGPSHDAVATLAALRRLHPQRRALRCVYDAFVTHLASELSAGGRHEQALRLVEQCLREQPQDLIYHQNRAALFTLLRESIPYHESWAALNQLQYRLILFGALDAFTLSQVAKTHRLFAQQARGGSGARGIFRYVEDEQGDKPRMVTNVDEIASDPDLLRQWIHHAAAELVFRHTAIGTTTNERLFLHPRDRDQAFERTQGLVKLADSLATLVPDEGAAIAKLLGPRWRRVATSVQTQYEGLKPQSVGVGHVSPSESSEGADRPTVRDGDVEVDRLKRQHVEVLGDLCLICLQWRPQYAHLWVAEELLEFLEAEATFFDEAWVYELESAPGSEAPYAVRLLANQIRSVAGVEKTARLTPAQRKSVLDSLAAELLREMANATYVGFTGTQKDSATRAMPYVDRARALRSADADIEFTAARILALGEFFEEAKIALDRFRRVVKPESQAMIEEAEKIAEVLRERRKEGKPSEKRDRSVQAGAPMDNREFRVAELERDLDRTPASWRLYEEIVQELALAGRFSDAIQWADRGVAHCLRRAEQMNARGLAIAARGMHMLAEANPRAARLYAAGAHEPARKAIEAIAETSPLDYTLLYLLGRCQLAGGIPDAALESFKSASELCERQMHRTVLRQLTSNIDSAYLGIAHGAITSALQERSAAEALEEAMPVFSRLRDPASWLLDFARIFFTSALNRVGSSLPSLTVPKITLNVPWQPRFAEALALQEDVDRALALCTLAVQAHPSSTPGANALAERTRTLKRQIAAVDALNHSGRLLQERKPDEVLAHLDQLDPAISSEPRLLRIRVLALLSLRRFDHADTVIEQMSGGGSVEVREFVAQYPALSFRQRIAAAQQFLRDLKPRDAETVLRAAAPGNPKEEADVSYCRAFASALEGYELRRAGRDVESRPHFLAALGLLEPHLTGTGYETTRHIVELYDRLEKEIESHAGR